jgi:hypothetical protein
LRYLTVPDTGTARADDGWMGWRKMNLLDRMNGFARFALEPLYVVIVTCCVASSEEFGMLSGVREGI